MFNIPYVNEKQIKYLLSNVIYSSSHYLNVKKTKNDNSCTNTIMELLHWY